MLIEPLRPEQLRSICSPDCFEFTSTAELPSSNMIIGQPRGIQAIKFGVSIQNEGYNIYIMGETGTGRTTAIEHFLREQAQQQSVPDDWLYVHNFQIPHQPQAIALPAGKGKAFQTDMRQLIASLQRELPRAFSTKTYEDAVATVTQQLKEEQQQLLNGLREKAISQRMDVVNTPSGYFVAPIREGQPLSPEAFQALPTTEQQEIQTQQELLAAKLEEVLNQMYQLENKIRGEIDRIDRQVAETATQRFFDDIQRKYAEYAMIVTHLKAVHEDVVNKINDFVPTQTSDIPVDLRRYEVNLLVDNSQMEGAPVIMETNPTYHNLIGRIEYEMRDGVLSTHFTHIKAGSLHKANGGYLILHAEDILNEPTAWETLIRTLKTQELIIQTTTRGNGGQVIAKSLTPLSIPLSVKIILLGSPQLFYYLYEEEIDFKFLFKVRADFDLTIPRDELHIQQYAQFVATRCHEENLRHFERSAVAKVVEFGSWLATHQQKLSTRFGQVADLVREASYWAGIHEREVVTAVDVQKALTERAQRANLMEEKLREQIITGSVFIATDGVMVGQVNGLTVLDTGDYSFGQPGRITARTFMGNDGIVHIERETNMSGPIHEKGVLTLTGYLGGMYAQHNPLTVTASLTFEQNYSLVDGDSASSAELFALLSSLSRIPIKQGIAVTGSVNQRGEVQPIGGVNEKIEGFFHICQARGLTGEQGVLIPAGNVPYLMLHEDVVTAVTEGVFHVWPIKTIDEGIEILTGVTTGTPNEAGHYAENTFHYAVQKRLVELAEELGSFGKSESNEGDE